MASNIPPHNIKETIDAVVKMINNRIDENRDTEIEELMSVIQGPDFPTGATIIGRRGIEEAYRTGKGKIIAVSYTHLDVYKRQDYETRVAILHKKEETENTKISDDIINYIAENINTNIRELEGALNRITAFKRLSNKEITLNMAEDVLRDIINNHKEVTITVPLIVEVIASHFGFEADELLSQKRNKDIAYSRQIAMYLCRQMTDLSLQQIGKELGNRDHTTVWHGIEKITEDLKNSQFLQDTIDVLQKKINPALG